MVCAGSHALCADLPDEEEGEAAREGTAAHEVLATLLTTGEIVPAGAVASKGVEVTPEMVEGAAMARDAIYSDLRGSGHQLHVERPVTCYTLHPDCYGTPDAWVWQTTTHLHIWDYKFGHRFVNEFENWQLLAYASDLVAQCGRDLSDVTVSLHIIQPRAYGKGGPVRTWTVKASELEPYWFRIRTVLQRIDEGNTQTMVNKIACRDCKARHCCTTLERAAQSGIVATGQAVRLDLPTRAAAVELRLLEDAQKAMEARISGLRAQLEGAAKAGESFPFYTVGPSYGREKWSIPDGEVKALGELFGVDLMAAPKPVTPNQARKLVPSADLLAGKTEKPVAMVLQEADTDKARRVFSA
jgi:hypothetical protein